MKKIVVFAFISAAFVISIYMTKFGYILSDDHSRWSDFGSFLGGTLGPIFSFCSLLYLAYQVEMQWKESRQARQDAELNHRERDIETNLKLLLSRLSSTDSLINTTLAELIVRVYKDKPIAEINLELFKLGFSARAETLVIWVNISASLSYLKALNENRFLSQKALVAIQLSHELCSALDYVVSKATGIKFETHF